MNFRILYICLFFISCYRKINFTEISKEVEEVSFLKVDNSILKNDIKATLEIDNGYLYASIEVPKGTDRSKLVPNINFTGGVIKPLINISDTIKRFFDFSSGLVKFTITYDYFSQGSDHDKVFFLDVYEEGAESNKKILDNNIKIYNDNKYLQRPNIPVSKPLIIGFFPSSKESNITNTTSIFRNLDVRNINTIYLGYAKPNMTYSKNSFDISKVGLTLPYDGNKLKESIQILKRKGIKLILDIGGKEYWEGASKSMAVSCYDINYSNIKDFIDDFGFDGINWSYFPDGYISILAKKEHIDKYIEIITKTRNILPKNTFILSISSSGVGALGSINLSNIGTNDDNSPYRYKNANNYGGELGDLANKENATTATLFSLSSTGHFIPVMKSVGNMIDIVSFNAFNVGGATNRKIMYDSYTYYANIYGFNVVQGVIVEEEKPGPFFIYNNKNISDICEYIYIGGRELRAGKDDGVIIYDILSSYLGNYNNTGYNFAELAKNKLEGK